jgi:hypothetical protein
MSDSTIQFTILYTKDTEISGIILNSVFEDMPYANLTNIHTIIVPLVL